MRRVIMHFVYTTVISGAHEAVLYKHDGAKIKIKGEGLFLRNCLSGCSLFFGEVIEIGLNRFSEFMSRIFLLI